MFSELTWLPLKQRPIWVSTQTIGSPKLGEELRAGQGSDPEWGLGINAAGALLAGTRSGNLSSSPLPGVPQAPAHWTGLRFLLQLGSSFNFPSGDVPTFAGAILGIWET